METNWQKIKISDTDYFSIQLGGTPTTGVAEYWNGDILWVTPIDLSKTDQPVINETIRNITESGSKNSSAKLLPKGSIVISTRAPIGYLGIAGRELAINQGCKALIIKKSDKTDSKFLYYLLLSKIKLIKSLGTGSTFLELSKSELGSIELNFPPKPTQQKIVIILDTIQAEVGKQKEIIEKTKELKKTLMKKLFSEGTRGEKLKETEIGKMPIGWEVVRLGNIAEINPQSNNNLKDDDKVGFVTMAGVSNDGYIQNIQERLYREVRNGFTKFQNRDYLFAKITPCMENGKGGLYQSDKFKYGFGSTEFHIIRATTKMLPEFVNYLVNIEKFRKTAAENMSGACGQKRVPKDFLIEYKFSLPPIVDQKEIVSILQKVDERIELAQKQKRLYEELFHTTLNKLMTGKIDVSPVIPAKAGIQD